MMIIGTSRGTGVQYNNFGRKIPKWIIPPNPAYSTPRITKITAFASKDKGKQYFSFRRNTKQRFEKMQCNAFSDLNHSQLEIESIAGSTEVFLIDLDGATAKTLIGLLGPFLSGFGFLFILRIVMSWYPKLPVEKFPYVIAYAPTEPLLAPTRKLIPPLAGVDVTPVVWFGLLSFLNEILLGPQGLLVLLSQQL